MQAHWNAYKDKTPFQVPSRSRTLKSVQALNRLSNRTTTYLHLLALNRNRLICPFGGCGFGPIPTAGGTLVCAVKSIHRLSGVIACFGAQRNDSSRAPPKYCYFDNL